MLEVFLCTCDTLDAVESSHLELLKLAKDEI